jgi:transcriptional regulator with XRE-family HTH domain
MLRLNKEVKQMKTGLPYIAEVFNTNITDVAERIGCSVQQLSMWSNGKRPYPQKWLDKLKELDEFKDIPDSLFTEEMNQFNEIEIRMCRYYYLIKKTEDEDKKDLYYERIDQLNNEIEKKDELETVSKLLDSDDETYMAILKRMNFFYTFNDEYRDERLEGIISMLKLLSKGFFDKFEIEDENEFTQELYELLKKYDLMNPVKSYNANDPTDLAELKELLKEEE